MQLSSFLRYIIDLMELREGERPVEGKPKTPNLLERIGLKRRPDNPIVTIPTPADDAEQIEEIRASLGAASRPAWARKEVDPSSVDIGQHLISRHALRCLGKAINEIKQDPYGSSDLEDIKPPKAAYPVLPMIASVIANRKDPAIPVSLPSREDVEKMKPWLGALEKFIGRFSESWARRFGRYVEKRGQRVVLDTGLQIATVAEKIGTIGNPRNQFLTEVSSLYQGLAKAFARGPWQDQTARPNHACPRMVVWT